MFSFRIKVSTYEGKGADNSTMAIKDMDIILTKKRSKLPEKEGNEHL